MNSEGRFTARRTIGIDDGSAHVGGGSGAEDSHADDADSSEGPPEAAVTSVPASGSVPTSVSGAASAATIVLTRIEVYFQVYPGISTINGTPIGIANQAYTIQVGSSTPITGTTNSDGKIEITFPPGATVKLTIFGTEYDLTNKRTLEPVRQLAGMQRRLAMLGYELGSHNVDGSNGKFTAKAIQSFQCDANINLHGRPRRQTRDTISNGTWIGE